MDHRNITLYLSDIMVGGHFCTVKYGRGNIRTMLELIVIDIEFMIKHTL